MLISINPTPNTQHSLTPTNAQQTSHNLVQTIFLTMIGILCIASGTALLCLANMVCGCTSIAIGSLILTIHILYLCRKLKQCTTRLHAQLIHEEIPPPSLSPYHSFDACHQILLQDHALGIANYHKLTRHGINLEIHLDQIKTRVNRFQQNYLALLQSKL